MNQSDATEPTQYLKPKYIIWLRTAFLILFVASLFPLLIKGIEEQSLLTAALKTPLWHWIPLLLLLLEAVGLVMLLFLRVCFLSLHRAISGARNELLKHPFLSTYVFLEDVKRKYEYAVDLPSVFVDCLGELSFYLNARNLVAEAKSLDEDCLREVKQHIRESDDLNDLKDAQSIIGHKRVEKRRAEAREALT